MKLFTQHGCLELGSIQREDENVLFVSCLKAVCHRYTVPELVARGIITHSKNVGNS